MKFLDMLKVPEARSIDDIDSSSTASVHARIIHSKGFLRSLYTSFYNDMRTTAGYDSDRLFVEIGSGGGFIKELMPNIVTSDVVPCRGVDVLFRAESLPFDVGSVCGIFMLNCFHHLTCPASVLAEFQRVLHVGGFVVMIEPSNTPWARFVYRYLHHETFDPAAGWSVPGSGRLSSANGALPWIVFLRDREHFSRRFPSLKLESVEIHTPFSYLLSGGMTWWQMVPSWSYSIARAAERLLAPAAGWLGMFMTVKLSRL